METARIQLVKNNIIAKLGLLYYVDEQRLQDRARRVIEQNKVTTLETADRFFENTGIGTPCMDGMAY